MAYDVELAHRVRQVVRQKAGLSERHMFGGLAFMVHARMAVAATNGEGLMVRIDPARSAELVREPHVRRFTMRGRELDGWLLVDLAALGTDDDLRRWVDSGIAYARSLSLT